MLLYAVPQSRTQGGEMKSVQTQRQEKLKELLLTLLPNDNTAVGNITLLAQFQDSAQKAGLQLNGEEDFKAARDALVAAGQAVKGRGRGGSLARADGEDRPDFDLKPNAFQSTISMIKRQPKPRQPPSIGRYRTRFFLAAHAVPGPNVAPEWVARGAQQVRQRGSKGCAKGAR